jgi:Protein of unknown function (DUF4238)
VSAISHQYLPQVYLRRFTRRENRKLLWEYDKTTGTVSESTPKKSGCEDRFHAFKKQDGSLDTESIENHLGQIETQLDSVYEAVRMRRPLTKEEWAGFLAFAGSMSVRVPAFINNLHRFTNKLYSFVFDIVKTNPKFRTKPEQLGVSAAALDNIEVTADRDVPLLLSLGSMETPIRLFSRMNWQFLLATAPDYFITGDVPVFHCAPAREKSVFPPGLADQDIKVTFPQSRTICAFGKWQLTEGLYRQVNARSVEVINARTAAVAKRYLYGPRKDSKFFAARPGEPPVTTSPTP